MIEIAMCVIGRNSVIITPAETTVVLFDGETVVQTKMQVSGRSVVLHVLLADMLGMEESPALRGLVDGTEQTEAVAAECVVVRELGHYLDVIGLAPHDLVE